MKIEYYKSIGIQQLKDNHLELFNRLQFDEKSLFETLNNYNYLQTCEIIEKLALHISNKSDLNEELELDGYISTIRIFQNNTIISDNLWGMSNIHLDTRTILELMLERKSFMSSWTRKSLISEVNIMFHKLTKSKNFFLYNSYHYHYKIQSTNPKVFFDVSNFRQEESVNPNDLLKFIIILEEYFNFFD